MHVTKANQELLGGIGYSVCFDRRGQDLKVPRKRKKNPSQKFPTCEVVVIWALNMLIG